MEYKICKRCIIDSSVPGARFDERGECSYCKIHDKLDKLYPLGEEGKRRLERIIRNIKAKGRNKKYDCVVGFSGGRDSTYALYLVKQFGLRPLAVHIDNSFGNPIAEENMKETAARLGIDLRMVKSDRREASDLRIATFKASVPDVEVATDVAIEGALFGTAVKENVKTIISGYSFRTEGICPLEWNYQDGKYVKSLHKRFGTVKLKAWRPEEPGFNLGLPHIFYYTFIKGITAIPILNYVDYVLTNAQETIEKELGWNSPGSKYYDDLYQGVVTYVDRVKFNIERRRYFYSARIRSGQMKREDALQDIKKPDSIEDPKIIDRCIKGLGITREEFERYMAEPPQTFRDYPTSYPCLKAMKLPVKILSRLNILPGITYDKYFECV